MSEKKLWQVGVSTDALIEEYTVGKDYILDMDLIPYDVQGSLAHAEMLCKIGVISQEEWKQAEKGLKEVLHLWEKGEFIIKKEQEDCHTAIEQFLTLHYGEVGKKIHTGRSRNDQILVTMRLFMKDFLLKIGENVEALKKTFQTKIGEVRDIEMPGYTHMQKAMPTTVGTWLDSYLQAIEDFSLFFADIVKLVDQNPLGSASGFGISSFALDREFTTQKLSFAKVQKNPMYCGFSRGYFENIVLQVLSQLMIVSSRFATDMMLYTMQEFQFFALPNNFTTGSSMMPQKRNYDVFEIMRGNVKVFLGYQTQIQDIIFSLGNSYHRDLQLTKEPFIASLKMCSLTVNVLKQVISNLIANEKNLKNAMTPDLYLTAQVYELVKKGWNFRDAYVEVKKGIFEG